MTYLNERWEEISRRNHVQNVPTALMLALFGLLLFVLGLVVSTAVHIVGAAIAFAGLFMFGLFGLIYSRSATKR